MCHVCNFSYAKTLLRTFASVREKLNYDHMTHVDQQINKALKGKSTVYIFFEKKKWTVTKML